MNSSVIALLALCFSLACLIYLRQSDPKRRRVLSLPLWSKRRYVKQAWFLFFLPGAVLIYLHSFSAFIIWFASLSLLGWLIVISFKKRLSN